MIKKILNACFVLICISFFSYQAIKCLDEFMKQQPLTRRSVEIQQLYPLPSICVQPLNISYSLHNLTQEGYQWEGKWRSVLPEFDDEETYNNISASFQDLVEQIQVERNVDGDSDSYETVQLSIDDDFSIDRCDYYFNLKCFCINISEKQNTKGIQRIKMDLKMSSEVTIVPPQNYYSFLRKQTLFYFEAGFNYNFALHHSITKSLSIQPNPCSEAMDWMQDPCKLKYINDKIMDTLNCTTPWLLAFARYISTNKYCKGVKTVIINIFFRSESSSRTATCESESESQSQSQSESQKVLE